MNKLANRIIILIFLICISTLVFAQPGDPQADPDNAVPIPGIIYLVAGGIAFGVKRILGEKNKIKSSDF